MLGFQSSDLRMLRNFLRLMVRDRFLGSGLGLIWAIANPVLMLAIFTFVFGFVFQTKLPGTETSLAYVIWLISGYGPWLAIAEGLTTSTGSVVAHGNLVKNLNFKSELLPVAGALIGIIPFIVTLVYLVILLAFDGRMPTWSWLTMIPVAALLFAFVIGIGLILSAINVFVRDVILVLPNILLIVMFASPIFYSISSFPNVIRPFMVANPIYLLAEGFRLPLLENKVLQAAPLAYLTVVCAGSLFVGLFVFRRFKPYFDSRL